MTEARREPLGRLPVVEQLIRLARPGAAVLLFLVAGCTSSNFQQPAGPNDSVDRALASADSFSAANLEGPAIPEPNTDSLPGSLTQTADDSSKPNSKPARPHTLPQALRAYFRCLCYGPPLPDKQPLSQAAEQEQTKN